MPLPLPKVALAVKPARKATAAEQAVLGVVKTGGQIAHGTAGLVSMATQKSADDFRTGKTPPSSFVPIGDRYKTDPWYKRIPKQVGDALTLNRSDPEVQKQFLRTQGAWSNAVNNAVNAEHSDADKSLKAIEPQLGTVGKVTNFASNLIPGARALDIPLAIGAAKNTAGGVIPALAAMATKKIPIPWARNTAQQALSQLATPTAAPPAGTGGHFSQLVAPVTSMLQSLTEPPPPLTRQKPISFRFQPPAGITGARG